MASTTPPPLPLRPPSRPSRRWRMPRTIAALILREMSTSYGRSPGGYLWAVLEPVAAIMVLSLIFSMMLRAPSLGTGFALFYASGYLPFMLFNDVANRMATSIRFSRALLAYPAVTIVDALIARFVLAAATHLLVGAIVLTGILWLSEAQTLLNLPRLLEAAGLAAILGFAIGVLNCYLMAAFPIWERAWQIATRPLFLISGVLFIFEDLPLFAREILWWNPLFHVTGIARAGLYSTYQASYASPVYVLAVAAVALPLGLLLLWRHGRALVLE